MARRSTARSCSGATPFPARLVLTPTSERSAVVPALSYDAATKACSERVGDRARQPSSSKTCAAAHELAAERAVEQRPVGAGVREAVLRLERQGAAQRIEPEHGVRPGDDVDGAEGVRGNEVPVDRVAEGLVEANAVE